MSFPKIAPPVKPTFINGITELRHFTLVTYSVEPQALAAYFEVFEKLNLVATDATPHSALIQQSTEFVIYLPPSTL